MKKPILHSLVNRNLFVVLLFLMCSSMAKAQWTFTFQFTTSGPCPAGVPYPVIPPLPNLGLPTQASCESLRQIILSTRQIVPIFNGSKYVGDCVLYYTCTTCTGSDLVYPGQGSSSGQGIAGEVSINSLLEGKSLFSSHQSQAFEDWATEYKQLLASYGITSILDKNFIVPKTPLTEDKYFNAQYTTLAANFKPKVAPDAKPKTKAPSTEESEFPSITMPIMGGSPLTQEERERQNLPTRSFNMMTNIRQESGIEESTPATSDLSESEEYKRVDAFFDGMEEWPGGKAPAAAGKLLLSFVNESDKLIRDMTINKKYSDEEVAEMNPVNVIINNVAKEQVKSLVVDKLNSLKETVGLNYLGSKYGEATKAGAEISLKIMNEAKNLKAAWMPQGN